MFQVRIFLDFVVFYKSQRSELKIGVIFFLFLKIWKKKNKKFEVHPAAGGVAMSQRFVTMVNGKATPPPCEPRSPQQIHLSWQNHNKRQITALVERNEANTSDKPQQSKPR